MTQPTHKQLLNSAKQHQRKKLEESEQYSNHLSKSIQMIIQSNSSNSSNKCPSVLDKITTIHQLNKNIDHQLNADIHPNFESLLDEQLKLKGLVSRNISKMDAIENLQRRVELIDQNLRILEHTLELVKKNRNNANP